MSHLLLDLRFSLRLLAKAPGFTMAAILSLALGIGANVTVYTWMRQTVLDPLPGVPHSGELLAMDNTDASGGRNGVSYPDFLDFRKENQVLQGLFAGQQAEVSLREGDGCRRLLAWYGSWDMFQVLGVKPALGRFFQPEDDRPGQPVAAVLSHRFWMRQFGGDPSLVGRGIWVSGRSIQVVGVAPEGFFGPIGGMAYDLFVPLEPFIHQGWEAEGNLENRRSRSYYVIGRPRPGVSFEEARRSLSALSAELTHRYPQSNGGMRLNVYPFREGPMGAPAFLGKPIALLFVAVVFILLIACANVANLLLSKAAGRQRELAIRAAMGAGRGRLIQQMLTESSLLGLAGGLAGTLVSFWTLGLFAKAIPATSVPIHFEIRMDGQTLVFALGLSLATSILFGLIPALRGSDRHPAETLKHGDSRARAGHRRVQSLLLMAEVAISVMLLTATGLVVRSAWEIRQDKPGFQPKGLLYVDLGMRQDGRGAEASARLARDLRERLQGLPGVRSVSFSEQKLMSLGGAKGVGAHFEDVDLPSDEPVAFSRNLVGSGFFSTFGIPLVSGREIEDQDAADSQPVVMVNETLARRFWPGKDAIGRRIQINGTWRTVVGVSKDFKFQHWTEKAIPFVYLPLAQFKLSAWNLVARVDGSAPDYAKSVRKAVADLDPTLPATVEDMEVVCENAAFLLRISAYVLGGMGLVALFLSGVGIYGVVAYAVHRRKAEIGLRMALGASPGTILAMVLKQGGAFVFAGVGAGLLGAVFLGHRFADLLYRTCPVDPAVFLGTPLVLTAVALSATLIPALRASRVDPAVALRTE